MANRDALSKKALLKLIHTWIGIVAGVFLTVLALTGSVIVFRAELAQAALPKSAPAADPSRRAGLDDAGREVNRIRPDAHIRRVRLPGGPGDPYIFQVQSSGKRTERFVSDASSGRVIGVVESGWVEWVVDLHRNFLSGTSGRSAVGIAGIVLFVLGSTGLLMWLSGARRWRAWISVRRGGSARRFNFELHRVSGLWTYGFLVVIAFTGIGLSYPAAFRQAVLSVTGKPATMQAPKGIAAELILPLDDYLRIGRAAMPDGVPVELRLPEPGKGPVDLRLYRAGDLAPSANHVYLDPATAAVVRVDRIADRPIGARFLAALGPIHYGQFGGIPIKVAWALLGLTPVLLFVTGLIAWWRPAKRKSNQAPAPEQTGSEDLALAGVRFEQLQRTNYASND